MLKGLERLQKQCEEGGSQLINVLLGQSSPSTVQKMDDIIFFDETLNDSQREAVKFALGSPEISLIHGPPGVKKEVHDYLFAYVIIDRKDIYTDRDYPSTVS